jgi:cell division protein FtsW
MISVAHRYQIVKTPTLNFDWLTLGLVMALTLLGVMMVFNASNVDAYYQFGDKFHLMKLQLIWLVVGLAAMGIMIIIPLSYLRKISTLLFTTTLFLLLLVLIPGIGNKIQGARRWLYFGSLSLQPSELIKLVMVIYFPAFLTKHTKLGPFIAVTLVLFGLLILEPDLGTALIILGVAFFTYFLAGAPMKYLLLIILTLSIFGGVFILTSSYRMARLKTFFNPSADPLGSSYHIRQVILSLGSGGLTGAGIGRSRQKYQYLPEASTDSIFAVTAEETGFLGSLVICGLFAGLYLHGFRQLAHFTNSYTYLVAVAVMSWLSLQTLINIAAMVVLIPLTGVPLPFISYGGSSLVTALMGIGLYLNASRHPDITPTLNRRVKNYRSR